MFVCRDIIQTGCLLGGREIYQRSTWSLDIRSDICRKVDSVEGRQEAISVSSVPRWRHIGSRKFLCTSTTGKRKANINQTWLNTPDNRKGFASMFLDLGYLVYIVDQTSVGRGTQEDLTGYPLRIGSTSNISEVGFTNPQAADAYPQSQLHNQWPGTGVRGDPVFDAFESGFMPLTSNNTRQEISMRASGCELLNLIGPSFLVSHSIGAIHPILLSDECPSLVAGNVNLEPGNIPFQAYVGNGSSSVGRTSARPFGLTVTNLNYNPPINNYTDLITETVGEDTPSLRSCILQSNSTANYTIHTLPNVARVPYVAFTGEASPHATYDHCVIQYLNQVGVKTDWVKLADVGVHGNGHFGYLESNNEKYFKVVEKWISKHAKRLGRNE